MPTLCGLVGFEPSEDLRWDGRNVWPQIAEGKPPAERTLYWVGPSFRAVAVRKGDWKLITYRNSKTGDELFDLSANPYEKENLAARYPDRVSELKQVLAEQAARDNDRAVPKEAKAE
jgi:arylsulfatase A-like enzyme